MQGMWIHLPSFRRRGASAARSVLAACGLAAALILLAPVPALAYVDPGSGSFIFQILIAALVGGLFALKMFFKNIRAFFANLFRKRHDPPSP